MTKRHFFRLYKCKGAIVLKKIIITFLVASLLICFFGCNEDNGFSAESSEEIESTHISSVIEESSLTSQPEDDHESVDESSKDPPAQYPSDTMDATVEQGDEVHLCCYKQPIGNSQEREYLGNALLNVDEATLRFTEGDTVCPEEVVGELAQKAVGKSRWDGELICAHGLYEYLFRINAVNMTVKPTYTLPDGWNYRFGAARIGSFKGYNDEDAGAVDMENGDYFGFDERLTLGCSAWCGCIDFVCEVSASSVLKDQGKVSYHARHLAEENRENVWAEGAEGVGIGESIEIRQMYMGSGEAELTFYSICIVNGYAESKAKWQENGRVKSLKLYYEDEYMGLITLEDTMNPQYIDISALKMKVGNGFDADFRFEIAEVYEGSKYEDTCLTGIIIDFNGIFAH